MIGFGHLGFMGLADQGRQYVAGVQVEIVAGAIEVGGHSADKIAAVLAAIGLGQLDTGDLGDGVPFISRLQGAGKQGALGDRLGCLFGVNA